ncbi:MAG: FAD-dependent oxidoreductase [Candidatus Aminicenantes bacterium]|nr:MAG: FAD-dependent oxidoreductase [Candidatus Aminicenantes bacterium]
MLIATLLLMGLGLSASVMLAIASKVFYLWEDPRIEQVEEALLGANCGGCGYAGCSAAAEAVVSGKAKADVCVAGGFEIAQNVAGVMGLSVEEKEPEISNPGCYYGFQDADLKYDYSGVMDCRAAVLLYGGSKECNIGCLGLGTCVRACPFDALSMGENNLPVVNKERCTGCGVCAENCPKGIITLTSAARRILSDYKVTECTAPCQRQCPAEIDIPGYIRQISAGNYLEAVRVIREKNPFPLICGWICPAPCEYECRRNHIDDPVTINALKKFVSSYEMKKGERALPTYIPPAAGNKITVVGGGVEGLTAAYYLRRLGHQPKVFEATGKLGGILRYVITEDRLPREVLDWEINGILESGVEAETGKLMGEDFTLASLFDEGCDMVLLTVGGWDSRQILREKAGEENIIPGTYLLLDFLLAASKGKKKPVKEKVVIVGGGKTASKAANICLNSGAKEVTIVYPYSKPTAISKDIEIEETDKIKIIFSALPVELQGEGDQLSEISIRTFDGTVEKIGVDNVIVGSGRFPEMLFAKVKSEAEEAEEKAEEKEGNKWKTVEILKVIPGEADMGIFATGETGRPTDIGRVVAAVRRGRKMVRALHLYGSEEKICPEPGMIIDEKELQNVFEIAEAENLKALRGNIDSIMTLSEEETKRQAERCLNCGLICYKKELNMEGINEIPA